MGSKFTVEYYGSHGETIDGWPSYRYYTFWTGQSMEEAFIQLQKAKEKYPNCVKLTWR